MIALTHAARVRRHVGARIARRPPRALERLGAVCVRALPAARALSPEAAGRRVLVAVLGALALGSSAGGARALGGVAAGAWAGWLGGGALDARARRAAAADAARALPVVVDRLATCVLAGMSVERALRVIAPGVEGPLGDALRDGLRALDAGVTRAQVYARIAARSGADEVRTFTATLARAERFGTPVSAALVACAAELRARARAAAETEARAAPLKMVFPLVFCFLPAFVLLTIAPIALSAVRTIGGV